MTAMTGIEVLHRIAAFISTAGIQQIIRKADSNPGNRNTVNKKYINTDKL